MVEKRIIWIATGLKYTQRGNGKRRDRPSQSTPKKEADLLDKLTLAGVRLDVRLPWETEQMNEQRWEREREREGGGTGSKVGGGRTRNSTYTPVTSNPRPPARL